MKRELRDKWCEALRSGKYLQGRGALRVVTAEGVDSYCCLGVLCDLVDPAGWRNMPRLNDMPGKRSHKLGMGGTLGYDARTALGIGWSKTSDLAKDNDSGSSFLDIAGRIEAEVEVED